MNIDFFEILGLIGIVLMVSTGKIFEQFRNWLCGFQNELNPLRLLGEMLKCPMCLGIWVGFLWFWLVDGLVWHSSCVLAGCISFLSLVAHEFISIISANRLRREKQNNGPTTMQEILEAREKMALMRNQRRAELAAKEKQRRLGPSRDISEEEAHKYTEARDRAIDSLILGEDR